MPAKNRSLFYIFGSAILIFAAIIVTALIQKTQTPGSSEDIRARAGIKNSLRLTGTVVSVDSSRGTVLMDNVQFTSSAPGSTSLGKWTVTAPASFSVNTLFPGTTITITVDASTFKITSHTVAATEIKVNR